MFRRKLGWGAAVASLVVIASFVVALSAGAATSKSDAGYKIYFIPKFIGVPVFTENGIGAKRAGKELGDTVTYNGPTTADATKQVAFINSAVQQGYNAIVISTPDANAVAPALKRAQAKGLKIVSYDGDTAPDARSIFVSPPSSKDIGAYEVQWIAPQIGFKGEIAIVSAGANSANQNAWIKYMKQELKKPKYKNIKLVKIVYGNDDPTLSAKVAQGLLQAYPNLAGIISPTGNGLPAVAQVLQQEGKCGKVKLTGLGTPLSMKKYVKSGCVAKFGLWDEQAFGYLAVQVAHNLLTGTLTGKVGEVFKAGTLGKRQVVVDSGVKPVVVLGPPLVFNKGNIDKYKF